MAAYREGIDGGSLLSLPVRSSSHWQFHFFKEIRAHFFRISGYTEEQLRHPASCTEQLCISGPSIGGQPLLHELDHSL